MTDSRVYSFETLLRERTYDLDAGTQRARDTRESLMAELDALRDFIPRQEGLRLEILIERLCGVEP